MEAHRESGKNPVEKVEEGLISLSLGVVSETLVDAGVYALVRSVLIPGFKEGWGGERNWKQAGAALKEDEEV